MPLLHVFSHFQTSVSLLCLNRYLWCAPPFPQLLQCSLVLFPGFLPALRLFFFLFITASRNSTFASSLLASILSSSSFSSQRDISTLHFPEKPRKSDNGPKNPTCKHPCVYPLYPTSFLSSSCALFPFPPFPNRRRPCLFDGRVEVTLHLNSFVIPYHIVS